MGLGSPYTVANITQRLDFLYGLLLKRLMTSAFEVGSVCGLYLPTEPYGFSGCPSAVTEVYQRYQRNYFNRSVDQCKQVVCIISTTIGNESACNNMVFNYRIGEAPIC